jgi:putative pyruvate formate lyase activating enzyme
MRGFEPAYLEAERAHRLQALEEELWDILRNCRLCARSCGVNRIDGDTGFCGSSDELKVQGAAPHFGEEEPLVGRYGSGTIFFSNCNLLCCFCQNWEIAHQGEGIHRTCDELARTMLALQHQGCHNINLVTPTHFLPQIIKGLRIAVSKGLRIPLVYNTGGYDNPEIIRKLDGIVDIYLPDFKYMDGNNAARYSSNASDYPAIACAVIKEMHRQAGALILDANGVAQRGLMIRHLVMPGNMASTDNFVRWVARELSPRPYVNIMAQYHPAYRAFEFPEIARRIDKDEWRQALAWAGEAGIY